MSKPKNTNRNFFKKGGAVQTIDNLLTINSKKLKSTSFWFVVTLTYISFVNFFVLKTTPEIIFLQYFVIVVFFLRFRASEFARTWVPFIGFFLLYEFLRGHADDVSPFKDITLFWIHYLEIGLFSGLPTKVLQESFAGNSLVINVSLFFYTIFFYYSFLVGFLLWLKKPNSFREYFKKFLILSFVGLALFFLIPTAPPWYVNEIQDLGIKRYLYGESILRSFSSFTLYQYFIYGNIFAALPSLHSAWPMFTSLFLIKTLKTKLKYLTLIIPLMIGFSVVLAGEHYVIDVAVAFIIAYAVTKFSFSKARHLRNQISAK